MSDHSYDYDALAWSEHQADLLRQHAAGQRVNEPIDWANVIEEVQDVGLSELHSCESFLELALLHLIKAVAWPGSRSVRHWRAETITFLGSARRRFSPSMRQRIDLAELYRNALQHVGEADDDSGAPRDLRPACLYSLDDLLTRDPDLTLLIAKLAA